MGIVTLWISSEKGSQETVTDPNSVNYTAKFSVHCINRIFLINPYNILFTISHVSISSLKRTNTEYDILYSK